MVCDGWRSVFAEKPSDLTLDNNCMVIKNEKEGDISVPLDQINRIVVTSQYGSISLPLINALAKKYIDIIICNESHSPLCEVLNLGTHTFAAGRLIEQSKWNKDKKEQIWKKIVTEKIHNQICLLEKTGKNIPDELYECETDVLPGDITNREAQAARLYFRSLFGNSFVRFAPDDINSALNYGYSLIRSSLDRIIVGYGYNTSLGIHHHSMDNCFNLSCDLMEPFRPCVDEVVYENRGRRFDRDYKLCLLEMLQNRYEYQSKKYVLEDLLDIYTNNFFREMRVAEDDEARKE